MVSSTSNRQIKFSRLEEDLLALLPVDGAKVDTPTLVDRYYVNVTPKPLNARATIISRLRGIAAKAERAGLPWRIHKTKRSGPRPQTFWRVQA